MPAPPPVFLPDTLPALVHAVTRAEGEMVYAWGTEKGAAKVVIGVVVAEGMEEAEREVKRLTGRDKGREEDNLKAKVLGKVRPRLDRPPGAFDLDLLPFSSSSPTASLTSPTTHSPVATDVLEPSYTPVLYSPLKHLEALSLEPLRLDLGPVVQGGRASSIRKEQARRVGGDEGTKKRVLGDAMMLINSSRLLSDTSHRPYTSSTSLSTLFRPVFLLFSATLSFLLAVIAYPLPLVGSLSSRTALGRQLHTRISQALSLRTTYTSFRRELASPSTGAGGGDKVRYTSAHSSYIRFFNLLWLIANDLIVGFALASFLRDNNAYISSVLSSLISEISLTALRSLLAWLNSWPMGIKLNDELAGVFCSFFLFLSRLWEDLLLPHLLPALPKLLSLVALSGHLGASSLLALSSDLLNLLALPWVVCYALCAVAYRWSLVALGALFRVFRGKKFNPLRHRVEPASYDSDALLLGTILFVTLIFLFPTVVAFYLAFLSARLSVKAVKVGLGMGVEGLNRFPLFAVMLRVKAPGRLPGGVQLDYCAWRKCWTLPHLHLRNQPLSFVEIISSLSSVFGDVLNLKEAGDFLWRVSTGRLI
ncbi:hypothetical protein JCM8547_003383 [Rhodosporidiobolus lusitaniae]